MKKLVVPGDAKEKTVHPILGSIAVNAAGEIPVLGAVVDTWRDMVSERREKKLYDFLHDVADAINDLAEMRDKELDSSHIASDQFTSTLTTTAQLAMNTADETKRSYLKRFMVNYASSKRPDVCLAQVYQNLLASLSGTHLLILEAVAAAQSNLNEKELRVLVTQPNRSEAMTVERCTRAFELEESIASSVVASLEALGLLREHGVRNKLDDVNGVLIIRPLGRSFIEFVKDPGER